MPATDTSARPGVDLCIYARLLSRKEGADGGDVWVSVEPGVLAEEASAIALWKAAELYPTDEIGINED